MLVEVFSESDGCFMIYISRSGVDGWFYGTSWITGCSGFFPGNHTERSADTETWTLHK